MNKTQAIIAGITAAASTFTAAFAAPPSVASKQNSVTYTDETCLIRGEQSPTDLQGCRMRTPTENKSAMYDCKTMQPLKPEDYEMLPAQLGRPVMLGQRDLFGHPCFDMSPARPNAQPIVAASPSAPSTP